MCKQAYRLLFTLQILISITSVASQPPLICSVPYGTYNTAQNLCECTTGFMGSQCEMCEDDKVCQLVLNNDNAQCKQSLSYSEEEAIKGYTCALDSQTQSYISTDALLMRCVPEQKRCSLVLEQKKQVKPYSLPSLQCNLNNCSFNPNSPSFKCGSIQCNCPSGSCTGILSLAVNIINGNSVEISSKEKIVTFTVDNAPFPLSASCQASSCELSSLPSNVRRNIEQKLKNWMIALIVVACFLITLIALLLCFKFGRSKAPHEELTSMQKTESHEVDGPKLLSFDHISCHSVSKPSYFSDRSRKYGSKSILHNVSGQAQKSEILGILGPSGAGKSSLLNVLANVSNGSCETTGTISIDGKAPDGQYRKIAAYVAQEDTLYHTLTVRECIRYSAQLRMSASCSKGEILQLTNTVIESLKLEKVADCRIGSSGKCRSISGGEKRRVSIGMELVISPQILFLDEPTSGLDSTSANTIVQLIRTLADQGRIVVMSIHQPSSMALQALDRVMLLSGGKALYHGATADARAHFELQGYPFPEYGNVAEYLLDIASENHETINVTPSVPSDPSHALLAPEQAVKTSPHSNVPWIKERSINTEFRVLFWRAVVQLSRDRSLFQLHLLMSVMLALIGGYIFNNVSDDLAGFQNRSGAFFFTLTFFGFSSLSSINTFISERRVYMREIGAMYYTSFSYFFTKVAVDAISIRIIPAAVFASIFYFLMGLKAGTDHFFIFLCTIVLFNIAAGALTILLGVTARTVGVANLFGIVSLLLMFLFGGLLLNTGTTPQAVAWIRYISIFNFDAPGYPRIPVLGQVFLKTLNLEAEHRYTNLSILSLFIIFFYIAGYASLVFRVVKYQQRV